MDCSQFKSTFCSEAGRAVTALSISVRLLILSMLPLLLSANKHVRVMGLSPAPRGPFSSTFIPVKSSQMLYLLVYRERTGMV